MDTTDRPDGALAPWSPSPLASRPAQAAWDEHALEASAPPRMFNPKLVLRALRRHWWRILAVWMVGSMGLVYLAVTKIRPTYDAVSWINVEPTSRAVLTQSSGTADFGPYLDTQVLLLTSPEVLNTAIASEKVAGLKKIQDSDDPEADLRKELAVAVPQKGTHVIQVKLSGDSKSDVAPIVNAVVEAYLKKAATWTDQAMKGQLDALEKMETGYKKQVDILQTRVRDLSRKAGENPGGLAASVEGATAKEGDSKPGEGAGHYDVTLDQWRNLNTELFKLQIDRYKAETAVKFLEEELKSRSGSALTAASGPLTPEQVEEQIQQEFLALPDAARLDAARTKAENLHEAALKRIRKGRVDPTLKRTSDDLAAAKADYEDYWQDMYPLLKRRVTAAPVGAAPDANVLARERALSDARLQLEQIKLNERLLSKRLESAKIEVRTANNEILDVQFAKEELTQLQGNLEQVKRHLQQLKYDSDNGFQVKVVAPATTPRRASSDNRTKALLAAPVLMLALSCLMFIALEFKSGRVADPDELSQRIRVGVIGVVPPLPSLNSPNRNLSVRGIRDERRRVEEFVQSLDQLRVTLCAHRPGQSDRRCVLITSATGGEGKTTRAALLAGRCANAGLMTLLIDADLRRPSLGDLLEVPEGPGLVDVLAGDASPESAMVVIGNAGGFHLLPAGTIGQDPSRLLHGERLGRLIAQFRETFDMVIVDAPPVLAVPDALLLGRWTDGAILAVRHDSSRYPLVERANRRLASVGVAVLGAVVNGCRTMESAYGSYRYTPYAAAEVPGEGGGPEV
ncbi:MAG: wzc [Actinomycetia bacterium]|nr:wzc [Actinomycetes bacterium]